MVKKLVKSEIAVTNSDLRVDWSTVSNNDFRRGLLGLSNEVNWNKEGGRRLLYLGTPKVGVTNSDFIVDQSIAVSNNDFTLD